MNVVVLVSGGGTNLQALIDSDLGPAKIAAVISSRKSAYALERAKNNGIPALTVSRKSFSNDHDYCRALEKQIDAFEPGLVVLAGFLSILDPEFCRKYENRIINVHPALIPSFCGKGYYGLRVHEEALKKGVKVTGATVHFVTQEPDRGPIILQKAVDVHNGDTPEQLQLRVMQQAEHILLPKAVRLFAEGRIIVKDGVAVTEEEEHERT